MTTTLEVFFMNAQQAVVAALRHKTIIPAFNIPYLPMVEPVVQAIIDENSVAMVQVARLEWEKFESQSPEAVTKEYFKFCKEGYTLLHLDHIPAIDEDQKNVDFLPLLKRALDAGYRVPEFPHSRVCRRSRGALYFGRYCQKNNDHLRESTAPPAVAHADAAHARGLGGTARKDAGRQSGAGPLQRAAGARHAGGHAACAVPGTERSDHTGRIRRTPHTAVHPHRPADKRRLPDFQ